MKHPWNPQLFAQGARVAGKDDAYIDAANECARRIKKAHLPVIFSLSHFAYLTGVSATALHDIVDRRRNPYRVFRLKKKPPINNTSRPFRTISVPAPFLMKAQRWIAQNILNIAEPHTASFAFAPCNRLIDAADRHVGCRWLVKLDISQFFESIPERSIFKVFVSFGYSPLLSFELARLCTRANPTSAKEKANTPGRGPYLQVNEGHLPQGAPTSPMLANLAVINLDERLTSLSGTFGWTYTRYADDLAFSTSGKTSRRTCSKIIALVKKHLRECGLNLNQSKTRVAPPGARKIILGLLVDNDRPRLPQDFRNNIETHLFALNSAKVGAKMHAKTRGFASRIGMKRHIGGLIAFARQIDRPYAVKLYTEFNRINWTR